MTDTDRALKVVRAARKRLLESSDRCLYDETIFEYGEIIESALREREMLARAVRELTGAGLGILLGAQPDKPIEEWRLKNLGETIKDQSQTIELARQIIGEKT